MNFERFDQSNSDLVEQKTASEKDVREIESFFGKSLKCFKRWGHLGIAAGAILVAGEVVREQGDKDKEYDTHVATSFSAEELTKKEASETEIRTVFGEQALSDIYFGDREAYFERKEKERNQPEIKGFAESGWTNEQKYAFSEKYLSYPKGWIAGEVGKIEFSNTLRDVDKGHVEGGELSQKIFSKPTMYIYRSWKESKNGDSALPVRSGTIEHEFGHANDWETDMDLNIVDRQELLIKIHQRLIAEDSWHREGDHYHEDFADGSKEGLYKSAREYWAEICSQYFTDPKSFLKNHPEDFKIVDVQVKKNDPSFDIFNKDRNAFDPDTGKLREVWKDK